MTTPAKIAVQRRRQNGIVSLQWVVSCADSPLSPQRTGVVQWSPIREQN